MHTKIKNWHYILPEVWKQSNQTTVTTYMTFICLYRVIREEISIFCKVAVSVIMRKCVHTNMCIILNGYRNGAAWISRSRFLRFFFGEVNEKRSLQKKYEYATRFARSYFGCCCSYKGAWRSIQTKKERAILAHKLQSALTLTVWLLKSYCESLLFTNRYTLYQS